MHEVVVVSPGDGDERLQLKELFRVGDGSTIVCGLVSPVGWESPELKFFSTEREGALVKFVDGCPFREHVVVVGLL